MTRRSRYMPTWRNNNGFEESKVEITRNKNTMYRFGANLDKTGSIYVVKLEPKLFAVFFTHH